MKVLSSFEVVKMTGLSRVTLWRYEREEKFPKRVNLSDHRVGWVESEVEEWIENRPRGICQGRFHKVISKRLMNNPRKRGEAK
jgi:prophage regulatory protein